jgi:exodeoxyribonuclease VII large subunit
MPRKVTSQWDFGELFPAEQTRKVFTVAELTGRVREKLEREFGTVWVAGEISNLRAQPSGHIYFTLKDASAQLQCVLFRSERVESRDLLEDGQKIIAGGAVTVYEPRGQYQLRVTSVEFQGVGALQVAFEKLKRKLAEEGLFASERKRPLPRYPQRIGLVTSPAGAAIRDVLHVIQRRNPALEILLAPCRVQGEGAAAEIAAAMELLNQWNARGVTAGAEDQSGNRHPQSALDLILVTRGGGSIEDLWAFNEEIVARAIAASEVPVVSAVGHEIDFTIADFVADLRAATPSAAAEIITEGVFASRQFVAEAPGWMAQCARRRVEDVREELDEALRRLVRVHPRLVLDERLQRLDDLRSQLLRAASYRRRECRASWESLHHRFARLTPRRLIAERKEQVQRVGQRSGELASARLQQLASRLDKAAARLRLLSPDNVLQRGYSITHDAVTGRVIRSAVEVKPGQRLRTRLAEGEVRSTADDAA